MEGIPEFLRRTRVANTVGHDAIEIKKPDIIWRGKEDKKPPVTMPEKIRNGTQERASELFTQINGFFDDWFLTGSEEFLNPYEWLRTNEVTTPVAKLILERYQPELDELASRRECPQAKEAYSQFDSEEVEEMIGFWETLINDVRRYLDNAKVSKGPRKTRVVKVKPEKKVAKLKFLKEDADLKLVSVSPEKIIGAQELWTYNIKTKHLTQYKASGRSGFMVKGTTLQYFEPDQSSSKVLRKPEEVITEVLRLNKRDKILSGLTTKAIEPTGRINEHTILLRVA